MLSKEDLQAIAQLMNQTGSESEACVMAAITAQNEVIQQLPETIETIIKNEVSQAEARINIKIENEVTKRLDALHDGYKLTHEKQWELEKRVDAIERKLNMAG